MNPKFEPDPSTSESRSRRNPPPTTWYGTNEPNFQDFLDAVVCTDHERRRKCRMHRRKCGDEKEIPELDNAGFQG